MAHTRQSRPDSGPRVNMAHIRQSRPDSGLGSNVGFKVGGGARTEPADPDGSPGFGLRDSGCVIRV